jgi:hypothetical protein
MSGNGRGQVLSRAWHGGKKDESDRRSLIEKIMRLLHSCKKGDNVQVKTKLVNLARRLEAALYKSAETRNAYTSLHRNPTQLRIRVRELARESAMKRAILSAATPMEAAAIAANAGASVEEQEKIKEQHTRILRQRQRLMLLRHAARCTTPAGKCLVTESCADARKLWAHVLECKGGRCEVKYCIDSRTVLSHYRQCRDTHCLVCGPVRRAAIRSKEEEEEQNRGPCEGYRKPGLLESLEFHQLEIHIKECKTEAMGTVLGLVLRRLMEHKRARDMFNHPVDVVALNIPHYHAEIAQPMDLGTVRRKLDSMEYAKPQELADDVTLVYDNAIAFNPATHPVHMVALEMKALFLEEYDKALVRLDPSHIMTTDSKDSGGGTLVKKGASWKSKGKRKKEDRILGHVRQAGILAPRKNGLCTLCTHAQCVQCPMCESGCRTFEAPSLHCRGTCGSRVVRNASYWALPSTNYFIWCQTCYDNLRRSKELKIEDRTIRKDMLLKKKNCEILAEPWVQCDMCNEWMHQICGLYNPRAEAKYEDGRFVCPICRHKVMKDEKEEAERKAELAKIKAKEEEENSSLEDVAAMLGSSEANFHASAAAANVLDDAAGEPKTEVEALDGPRVSPTSSPVSSSVQKVTFAPEGGDESASKRPKLEVGVVKYAPVDDTKLPPQTPKTTEKNTTLLMGDRPPGAVELPSSTLSRLLQDSVDAMLKTDREEEAEKRGVGVHEVESAENICIRVVSSIDKVIRIKENSPHVAGRTTYNKDIGYRSKAILMFQRGEDDIDVCLFAMYVQEYGAHAPINNRTTYIAYLDSVNYLKPRRLRTKIYHEIIVAYLQSAKARGFEKAFIWACPPPHKRDDYILHCHPETQRMPSSDRLRQWYHEMIDKAAQRGIVAESTTLYEEYLEHHHPMRIRKRIAVLKKAIADAAKKAADKEKLAKKKQAKTAPKVKKMRAARKLVPIPAPPSPRLTRAQIAAKKRKLAEEETTTDVLSGAGEAIPPAPSVVAPSSMGSAPPSPSPAAGSSPTKARLSDEEYATMKLEELEPGVSRPLPPKQLPYCEGDFWTQEAEEIVKYIMKEGIRKAQEEQDAKLLPEGVRRPRKSRKTTKKAPFVSTEYAPATVRQEGQPEPPEEPDEIVLQLSPEERQKETKSLMRKLANAMESMKPDFLVVKLKHTCSRCHEFILNGTRYGCLQCESVGKPFNLCAACYELEEAKELEDEKTLHFQHCRQWREDAAVFIGASATKRATLERNRERQRLEEEVAAEVELKGGPSSSSPGAKKTTVPKDRVRADHATTAAETKRIKQETILEAMTWETNGRHTHTLRETAEETPLVCKDPDEKLDCPVLNSRLDLLGICQGNRYQFDQKRRAKHSSMMLLYHLHNPKVPLFVHQCNNPECRGGGDILGDCRYNCPICPDFDLCAKCFREVGPNHVHYSKLRRVNVDVSGTGTEDQEERKQRSLALFLESLVHTTSCKGCSRPECKKMRELLDHREKCTKRASGGCDTCQRILCLLQIHARRCITKNCQVLYCGVLKRRIEESSERKRKETGSTGSSSAVSVKGGMASSAAIRVAQQKGAEDAFDNADSREV